LVTPLRRRLPGDDWSIFILGLDILNLRDSFRVRLGESFERLGDGVMRASKVRAAVLAQQGFQLGEPLLDRVEKAATADGRRRSRLPF
jgi:hypothetical protein